MKHFASFGKDLYLKKIKTQFQHEVFLYLCKMWLLIWIVDCQNLGKGWTEVWKVKHKNCKLLGFFSNQFSYLYVPITFLQKTSTGKCLTSYFYHWHFLQKTFTSKCLVSFFISFLFFPRQNLQSRKFCQVNQLNQLLYLTMEPLLSSVRWRTHTKGRYLKKTTSSPVIWSRLAPMYVLCVSCFER